MKFFARKSEMKNELEENMNNIKNQKQSTEEKKEPNKNKEQEELDSTKSEKESKKNISRWDNEGGKDLCP
jgi:Ulp1 family protease